MGVSGGVIKGSIGATKGISNSKSSFLKSFVIIGHLLSLDWRSEINNKISYRYKAL